MINGSGGRERLAWGVLLAAFTMWVLLVIAVPVMANSMVQNWRQDLVLEVQANGGTVGLMDGNGERDAIFAGDQPRMVEGPASVLTNLADTAVINVRTPDETQVLARLIVYSNTNLDILARAPRFEISDGSYEITFDLTNGRLRLTLPERKERPVNVVILTPQEGQVTISEPGQYSVEARNNVTDVAVNEGQAVVAAADATLTVGANERALIPVDGPPSGPLPSERELIQNGDFNEERFGWSYLAWRVELPDQPAGETGVVDEDGEKVLRLHRVGVGHADTAVRQEINQDITDYEWLQLLVTLKISQQSLGVCGQQGSECPLFVRLVYEDIYGTEQVWQQGFYAVGDVREGQTPGICQTCAQPIIPHERVFLNQIYSYDTGNLLDRLAQQNVPTPRRIESLSLIASGHTFDTHVLDVSLIVDQ